MEQEILVVLGAPNSPTGALSTISKCRLDCCKKLFFPGRKVICTGGWGDHFNISSNPHAHYAKAYLIEQGLTEKDFLVNALSKNTVDDAVKVKAIVSGMKDLKLIVITSDYHLERVQLIFHEILDNFELEFIGVECHLDKDTHRILIEHEQEAIKAILANGLYY